MRRKPFVNAMLRIDEEQHRWLTKAAKDHGTTLNGEMRWVIDRVREQTKVRTTDAAREDLEKVVHSATTLSTMREIETAIAEAVSARDFDKAIELSKLREATRKQLKKLTGDRS